MISLSILGVLMGVSFMAGLVDSIAGGGGLLMMPAMLLSGIPAHFTLGTNKLVSTFGTSVSTFNFYKKGKLSVGIILVGLVFMLSGGVLGSQIALFLNPQLLAKLIMILLPVGMLATFFKKKNSEFFNPKARLSWTSILKLSALCLGIGLYDGVFGPGTGSFIILGLCFVLKLDLIHATANAKALNLLSNIGALTSFLIGGKVLFLLALPLALMNMAGNYIGSHLVLKKGETVVRLFLMISMGVLGVTLAVKYFFQ